MNTSISRHARLVSAGLCLGCRKPWVGPPLRCPACSARIAERAKAKRARLDAEARALGLEPRRKGWNGFQNRKHAIYARSKSECQQAGEIGGAISGEGRHSRVREQATREARRILVELRTAQRDDKLSVAATDVLHALFDRAYKLGYWKGWKTGVRKGQPVDDTEAA
jgi:hypothetical protein